MPFERRNLKIDEISLVPNPANEGAVVALIKEDAIFQAQMIRKSADAETLSEKLTKAEFYEAMQDSADAAMAASGLTREQRFVKWVEQTPEGNAAAAFYRCMRGHGFAPEPRPVAKFNPLPALDELEAKAREIRKSDPSMTTEQAMTVALEQNRGLYTAYREQRLAQIRARR